MESLFEDFFWSSLFKTAFSLETILSVWIIRCAEEDPVFFFPPLEEEEVFFPFAVLLFVDLASSTEDEERGGAKHPFRQPLLLLFVVFVDESTRRVVKDSRDAKTVVLVLEVKLIFIQTNNQQHNHNG